MSYFLHVGHVSADDSAPRKDSNQPSTRGTRMGHAIGLLAIGKGSASTLEGSYLAPSDWRDRSAIDASESRVALDTATENNKGTRTIGLPRENK